MKTYLALPLAVIAFASLFMTGGCTAEAELRAANRRAQEELLKTQEALRDVRAQNQKLLAELKARDGVIAAKDQEIAVLKAARDKLQAAFNDLKDKYDNLLAGQKPQSIGPFVALPPAMHALLQKLAEANPGLLKYYPELGMVKFMADMTFAPGSDEVTDAAKKAMAKLVEIMNMPEAVKFHLYIAGHTDDLRIIRPETKRRHPTNWYLSVHRSVAVEEIVQKGGLAPERIGVAGFSEFHPVVLNAPGHKGNKLNRRVEMWIVGPDKFLTTPMEAGGAAPAEEKAPAASADTDGEPK